MMKQMAYMSLMCLPFLMGCKRENMGDCFKSTGKQVVIDRDIPQDITRVILKDDINLVVHPDTFNRLKISAGENVAKLIKAEADGNTLELRDDNRCNFVRSYARNITAHVYLKDFRYLRYEGSGKVYATGTIKTDKLLLDMWDGSEIIDLTVDVDTLFCFNHVGPGDVKVDGKAKYARFYSDGNGFAYADSLECNVTDVNWKGTGNCNVWCDSFLVVQIKYIGDVYYRGTPDTITYITGTGKITHIE